MSQTEGAPEISTAIRFAIASRNTIRLFFGGAFSGIVLMTVGIELQGLFSWIPWMLGGLILIFSFKKTRTAVLATFLGILAGIMVYVVLTTLAGLAAGGKFGSFLWYQISTGWYFWAEIYLVIAILWLLIGVPHRAHKLEIDPDSNAQKTVVGFLSAAASILSGVFFVMLRFGGGPLYNVDLGLLVAGTIFTIFLVMPAYKSVANTCWRHGLPGLFNPKPFAERWGKTVTELDTALETTRVAEARKAYQQAIDSEDPNAPRAAIKLGQLLQEQGDTEGARKAYQQAADSGHPDAPEAAFMLGQLLREQGDADGARNAFRKAADSGHPVAPEAAVSLGFLLEDQGDAEGARKAYQQAIDSRHPDAAPWAAFKLGHLLQETGDTEGARNAFRKAIDSGHPVVAPEAAVSLGFLLEDQGDAKGACNAFRKAADSGHPYAAPAAKVKLGELLQEQGDAEEARKARQQEDDSGHPDAAARAARGGVTQQRKKTAARGGVRKQRRWQLELVPTRKSGSATFRLSSGSEAHDITWIFAPLETIKVDGKRAVVRFQLARYKDYRLSDLSSIIGSDVTIKFDQVRRGVPHGITVTIGDQILSYTFWP
jgi:tetratricopeptide (TPR) repeat protein